MYIREDAIAMKSPLGPILSNIFVGYCQERLLITSTIRPLVYTRYVDDTFGVLYNEAEGGRKELLERLNAMHPKLKFPTEKEKHHTLPFFNVSVKFKNKTFTTGPFRKRTGEFPYNSFYPLSRKRNFISCLTYR